MHCARCTYMQARMCISILNIFAKKILFVFLWNWKWKYMHIRKCMSPCIFFKNTCICMQILSYVLPATCKYVLTYSQQRWHCLYVRTGNRDTAVTSVWIGNRQSDSEWYVPPQTGFVCCPSWSDLQRRNRLLTDRDRSPAFLLETFREIDCNRLWKR